MDSRERLLTAINNEKPDRLPCQVHNWMWYYLQHYMDGRDDIGAYEYFKGMDWVLYREPKYVYDEKAQANWQCEWIDLGTDSNGNKNWKQIIHTPEGDLTQAGADTDITGYTVEYLIKTERDFELWNKYVPVPIAVDWLPVIEAKEKIGNKGIVRGATFGFGQGSPWQDFTCIMGTQESIMAGMENPDWLHYCLSSILEKRLHAIEVGNKIEFDLVETGGGAGSSTVISPDFHKEFCRRYDIPLHNAIHEHGSKIVYHLCGGLMPLLEIVAENGADGLETMTPREMGGDCDLAEANRRVGDRLFFIGGFDQNTGFENGTPAKARELVRNLHAARPQGGYICCASDHFFHGSRESIQAFVDECNKSIYK